MGPGCASTGLRATAPATATAPAGATASGAGPVEKAGVVVSEGGETRVVYPLPIAAVEDAMLEALNGRYKQTHVETGSDGTTRIESRSGFTRSATIVLTEVEGGTQARVRTGPISDVETARKILDRVSGRTGLIVAPPGDDAVERAAAERLEASRVAPDAVLQRERGGSADGLSYTP
jgi:hypothetical protein